MKCFVIVGIVVPLMLIGCHRSVKGSNAFVENDTATVLPTIHRLVAVSEGGGNLLKIKKLRLDIVSRANIPIYQIEDSVYLTAFDPMANILESTKTVYISPLGTDDNDGRTPKSPMKTIEGAMKFNPNTLILLNGVYEAGVNFKSGHELKQINMIGMGDVVVDNMSKEPMVVSGNVYIENIKFVNGSFGSLRSYITDTVSVATYVNCKFNSSIADNADVTKANSLGGLRLQGGTHYVYRCEASNNGFDGFSYHSAPDDASGNSFVPHVAEIECVAYNNGSDNLYYSNNATTAHDGAKVVRLNGRYGVCHGPIVADVHPNTVTYNIGCQAFCSQGQDGNTEFESNYFVGSGATSYLIGCKSFGSTYDVSVLGNSRIYSDNDFSSLIDEVGGFKTIKFQ